MDRLAVWSGLLFDMMGTGFSICMNGEIIVVEIIHNASSCEAGRGCIGNEGKIPQVPNGGGNGGNSNVVHRKDGFSIPGDFFKSLLVGYGL